MIACLGRFADIAEAMGGNIEGLSPMDAAEKAAAAVARLVKEHRNFCFEILSN
jgi:hypothetical protein